MKKAARKGRKLLAREPDARYSAGSGARKRSNQVGMLDEYDFSKGIRGKYAARYAEGANVVVVDPELARIFPDSASVNRALRKLAEITRRTS